MKKSKSPASIVLVLFGLVGMLSFSSCAKETTCECDSDGDTIEVTVEGDCESFEITDDDFETNNCREK